MAARSSNDNSLPPDSPAADHPDAHGQAALLLVESLIHGLIAQSLISVASAVEIIEIAVNVSREQEEEAGREVASRRRATLLLQAISKSLSTDLPRL